MKAGRDGRGRHSDCRCRLAEPGQEISSVHGLIIDANPGVFAPRLTGQRTPREIEGVETTINTPIYGETASRSACFLERFTGLVLNNVVGLN